MRTAVALCFVALILSASATTSFKVFPIMNTRPSRNIMTVMTQVEATLKSGGPIEIVNETLDKFEEEVTTEQAAHDALHERQTSECDAEFDFRRREVADASGALREASTTLGGCEDQERRAQADLNWVQKTLIETHMFLAMLADRREREANDFGSEETAYQFNAANLDTAVEILEELFTGDAEFVQLVNHAKKMMKGAIITNSVEKFGSAFASFAALATAQGGADNELLERLRNVLANLKDTVEENWTDRVQTEEELIAAYEAAKEIAESAVEELTQHESDLQQELAALHKCIVNQTGIVGSATAKRDRNQKLWDDASALCESSEEEYEEAKGQRREERDIIDALRDKIQQRFGLPE